MLEEVLFVLNEGCPPHSCLAWVGKLPLVTMAGGKGEDNPDQDPGKVKV